ncbi:MAG: hypothetical protein KQH79_10860 [Bacteroidetes bacterium]|nr:hypothetical protein [Bacteroidota bacterium]
MKNKLLTKVFLAIFLFLPVISLCQEESSNDTNNSNNDNYSSLMINASYTNNNLSYLAKPTDVDYETEKIPTLFTSLSFMHKTGFYLGGSYNNYFNARTKTFEFDIEAGYQKYFDNGFDIDLGYTYHNFNGDTLLEGLAYNHNLALMLGQEIDKFYLSADLNYKLGNTNNFFFDLNFSRFIQVNEIFSSSDVLLINPGISVSLGTDYWLYEDLSDTEKNSLFTDFKQQGYSYESFSYESFNIFIPISYGIKNIYLTGSWMYRIPGKKYEYIGWENQSSFMFSLTYFLNFY